MEKNFQKFLTSSNELEIWRADKLIFQSKERQINGLLKFIGQDGRRFSDLTIFDKVVGNAASLLFVHLKAKEVCGKVGSQLAAQTLEKFKIKFYFQKTIPSILNKTETDICPLEKSSLLKSPEEFLKLCESTLI